ncbi:hypothetical protein HZA43_00595 [Candidatus Peregrinibacteria bacterium]|nr:hypothetical protein [Candidatus Peregrinibacteria bacterium]
MTERTERSPDSSPSGREGLRDDFQKTIQGKAEKILAAPGFIEKLKPENIKGLIRVCSKGQCPGYRQWNEEFCRSVLGAELSSGDQLIYVTALQLYLNREVGGFSGLANRVDSMDGKFGPFTLNKLREYFEKRSKATETRPESGRSVAEESELKAVAPGVVSRLPEHETFDEDGVFYAGDSIMVGITGSGKVPSKMLVIDGGINDLGLARRVKREGSTRQQIIKTYERIIQEAHKRGKKITIYAVNDELGSAEKPSVYRWLTRESGADVVVDTTHLVSGRTADGIHPTPPAYKDLYRSLDFFRAR